MSDSNISDKNKNTYKQRIIAGVSVPVLVMGLVSLFTDISSEMIQSIFPFFIISIGGTTLIVGLIAGVTNALSNILKGITGWMSDKINRRKPFVVAGYSISNLSKPFIAFSPSWGMVLGLKAVDRAGKGLRTSARDTLISYYAIEKGKAFGLHRSMDTLGAVIGSLLAFLFLYFTWTYSQIIFFSIIPGICAVILIFMIKDIDITKMKGINENTTKIEKKKLSKKFIKFIIILGVIEFASLDVAFLMLRSEDYLGSELLYLVPLLYLLSNVVYVALSPFTGKFSDKIGRKPIIITGLTVLLVSCIILAFPITISLFSLILIIILFSCFGFYLASVDPISRAYVADLAGKNKRGIAYGSYYLSVGIISLFEAFIFGALYEIFDYTIAFTYISILLTVCMVIFILTDFSKILEKDS